MKKVATIFIAVLLVVSGMHFTIAAHYCKGNLSKTIISLNGKTADCGMEHSRQAAHEQGLSNNCCDDKVTVYTVDNDFSPSFASIIHFSSPAVLLNADIVYLSSVSLHQRPENPPGYDLVTSVEASEICILRI